MRLHVKDKAPNWTNLFIRTAIDSKRRVSMDRVPMN